MALVAGHVTVTAGPTGVAVVVGTPAGCLAEVLANVLVIARVPASTPPMVPIATIGQTSTPYSPAAPATPVMIAQQLTGLQKIYAGCQVEANLMAPALITYFTTNTVVTVTTTEVLTSLPAPPANSTLVATGPGVYPVTGTCDISGTGTGTIS